MLTTYIDACQVCDYFCLPPQQYIFSPRKKRTQQRNHLLVEHFVSCQVLHAFFNAQMLQLRRTTQTHSEGDPWLGELLTLARNTAQGDLF